MTDTPVADALAAFRASGSPWLALPFFAGGQADAVAARVDARIAAGARVLPAPDRIFRALTETPLPAVRVCTSTLTLARSSRPAIGGSTAAS